MSLDRNGEHKISIRDALLLMKATHGSQFSLRNWKRFQASRSVPNGDVYFDEIKMWLCAQPKGEPASSNEVTAEEDRLVNEKHDQEVQDYEKKKRAQVYYSILYFSVNHYQSEVKIELSQHVSSVYCGQYSPEHTVDTVAFDLDPIPFLWIFSTILMSFKYFVLYSFPISVRE